MNAITALSALAAIPGVEPFQNILIVNDDERFRSSYKTLLECDQWRIDEAATAREALIKLRDGKIDLLILDLRLPDFSGTDVMEWMTSNRIDSEVIVFGADSSIYSAIHALRQRAFEFLRKDCDPEEMLIAVEKALKHRRREKEHELILTQLKHSESLHRFLVEQSSDMIFTLDIEGVIAFINNRVKKLLGFDPEELIGQHYTLIVDPRDHMRAQYAFSELRIGPRATTNQEIRFRRKINQEDVQSNLVVTTIMSSQGLYENSNAHATSRYLGSTGVARDITKRKRAEETIAFQAHHDLLTKLPNRLLFVDRLELAIVQAKRRQEKLAVMFLDLDRFKLVNDSYGHSVGDQLLCEVAARVRNCLRTGDTLARQGGDEFTVLLPSISNSDDINVIAEKILTELRNPFLLAELQFLATTSIGVAIFPDDATKTEDLIRCAEMAMYQVKDRGKNGFAAFKPHMNIAHLDRLSVENDLRNAVKTGDQFELYFQPQVDSLSDKVIGLEALIRWHHQKEGLISPDIFIPVAEETGQIIAVSDWVLREACSKLAKLRNIGFERLRLGINLSPREFERDDLIDRIQAPMAEFRIPPEALELEITESLLMKDVESIVSRINHLRGTGIHISIDDFGTRYSSLNYLRRFSINRIKIDQSFVRELGISQDSYAIIQAIIGIARNFNLHVIAEGVETEYHLDILQKLGCNEMQGYFFGRPLPFSQIVHFLESRNRIDC